MKKILGLLFIIGVIAQTGWANPYEVLLEESSVAWVGTKVAGQHDGYIGIKSGIFEFDGTDLIGGKAVMDMTTITVADIKKEEMNQKLLNHLKSDDFFAVDKYPTATLVLEKVTTLGEGRYSVLGAFTIKDKTERVPFEAALTPDGETISGKAAIKIDRTKFDIRYGSGKFFEALGDKMIHDEFTLEVEIKAKKKA